MSAFLECHDLKKTYQQGRKLVSALQGVTLSVLKGEFLCIRGRSGSGKTTLLNCLGTLDTADSGQISLEGKLIESLSEKALLSLRRDSFGFVFQQFFLIPYLSTTDNVALPLVCRGERWKEARNKARNLLQEIGFSERNDQQALWLSGGEAQRVAIARALISNPTLLFADEPTGELDTATAKQVIDLLTAYKKRGLTLVVATHDPLIEHEADRILALEDGKILGEAPTTTS